MRPSHHTSADRVTVTIDADLEDIVPTFLSNRRKDVQKLRTALAQEDFETIRLLAHRMKGDGGGYGFKTISEIGENLELAAARHDHPAIEQRIGELKDFLSRVKVVYR
jgi:HPt (histidine-containing phosphotransfer) domain-containing protein